MRVSDRELLSRIESLARKEHATTIEILLHLNEVERRRLHLMLGYGTMFAFAGVLDDGDVTELIDTIRGKSQRDVERIVAKHRPVVEIRDRVRPVRMRRETGDAHPDHAAMPLFSVASTGSSNGIGVPNDTRSQVSYSRCGRNPKLTLDDRESSDSPRVFHSQAFGTVSRGSEARPHAPEGTARRERSSARRSSDVDATLARWMTPESAWGQQHLPMNDGRSPKGRHRSPVDAASSLRVQSLGRMPSLSTLLT
jgi:hypothetical protein